MNNLDLVNILLLTNKFTKLKVDCMIIALMIIIIILTAKLKEVQENFTESLIVNIIRQPGRINSNHGL